jgi:hypothetical protein
MAGLRRALTKDMKTLEKRTVEAVHRTAHLGSRVVRKNVPVAFRELFDSIEYAPRPKGAVIEATAPHAAAVEVGSRPHRPPIAPILAWVKLRGMQGVHGGPEADGHPQRVAASIRMHGTPTSTPVDAPMRVAWAIARAIEINGTKPTWFARRSLPEIHELLDNQIKTVYAADL